MGESKEGRNESEIKSLWIHRADGSHESRSNIAACHPPLSNDLIPLCTITVSPMPPSDLLLCKEEMGERDRLPMESDVTTSSTVAGTFLFSRLYLPPSPTPPTRVILSLIVVYGKLHILTGKCINLGGIKSITKTTMFHSFPPLVSRSRSSPAFFSLFLCYILSSQHSCTADTHTFRHECDYDILSPHPIPWLLSSLHCIR